MGVGVGVGVGVGMGVGVGVGTGVGVGVGTGVGVGVIVGDCCHSLIHPSHRILNLPAQPFGDMSQYMYE